MGALRVSENELLAFVRDAAKAFGFFCYHPHRSDHSEKGWPDIVLAKPPQLIFAELKSEKGRVSPEQQSWLDALRSCGQEVHVWRPRDMDAILERLRRWSDG